VNHYPKHIGDWMVATAHLTEIEECMYSRSIDAYYAREAPLPVDVAACCRLVRATSAQARKAVATVLREFFDLRADGWHQKRCDEEIAAYREKGAKASASAAVRWSGRNANAHANASANAMRTHSEGNANQNQNQNQEPEDPPGGGGEGSLSHRAVALTPHAAPPRPEGAAGKTPNGKGADAEAWWKTAAGVAATAETLGIQRRANEAPAEFKDRVYTAVQEKVRRATATVKPSRH
jgi:uncharacterized protein YdaU (DUF1376 family)